MQQKLLIEPLCGYLHYQVHNKANQLRVLPTAPQCPIASSYTQISNNNIHIS